MILAAGLLTVVFMAERLPVPLVPEQDGITAVRFDVVDVGGLDVPSILEALHAQRVRFQVTLPGFLPLGAVAPDCGGPYFLWVLGGMFVTVFLSTAVNLRVA